MASSESEVRMGELVGAAGGVALLGSMFLPWYGSDFEVAARPGPAVAGAANAWQAFSAIDYVLFAAGLVAVVAVLAHGSGQLRPAPGPILAAAGAAALVLILYRIVSLPGQEEVVQAASLKTTLKGGAVAGAVCAAAIAGGGALSMLQRRAP